MPRFRFALAILLLLPAPARAEDKPFHERVNEAIDRGVEWLLAKPKLVKAGEEDAAHWGLISAKVSYSGSELQYMYPAGSTSLALYTLLKCGVDPDHPVIERGFNWLKADHAFSRELDGPGGTVGWRGSYREAWTSYELSAEILALTARYDPRKKTKATLAARKKGKLKIKDKDDRKWLRELVEALIARRGVCEPGAVSEDKRGWRYNQVRIQRRMNETPDQARRDVAEMVQPKNQDLSSTQLATLALFSAWQFGVKAEANVWLDVALYTLTCQEAEGPEHERHDPGYKSGDYAAPKDRARGFAYIPESELRHEGKPTGAMTACGIANLLMAKSILSEDKKGQKLLEEHKLTSRIDKAVFDGLAWLDLHWSPFENPGYKSYHIYYLYGLERAMDLLDKELVGKHLWYREGAEKILENMIAAKVRQRLPHKSRKGPKGERDAVYWETGSTHKPYDVLDTCFALLFLKRATKDVVPGGVPVTGSR